jgi:hypothetical protein
MKRYGNLGKAIIFIGMIEVAFTGDFWDVVLYLFIVFIVIPLLVGGVEWLSGSLSKMFRGR